MQQPVRDPRHPPPAHILELVVGSLCLIAKLLCLHLLPDKAGNKCLCIGAVIPSKQRGGDNRHFIHRNLTLYTPALVSAPIPQTFDDPVHLRIAPLVLRKLRNPIAELGKLSYLRLYSGGRTLQLYGRLWLPHKGLDRLANIILTR